MRLLRIADWLDWCARSLGKAGGWLIMPLILVIMFDVITRRIDVVRIWMAELRLSWFNPIIFQDAEWHLHGALLLLSFGFGYLLNAHVRVDIFREMLPRRAQMKLEFFGLALLGIPFLIVISYFGFEFVKLSYFQNEGSESLTGIPSRYIIKSFLLVGFVLLLFSFVATLLRLIVALWSPDKRLSDEVIGILPFVSNGGGTLDATIHDVEKAVHDTHATDGGEQGR